PGVKDMLNSWPTDQQIQKVCQEKNIKYDPSTQYILWYVIKCENGTDGKDVWHVDGVLLDKSKVPLSYDPNALFGVWVPNTMPDGAEYYPNTVVTVSPLTPQRNDGYEFVGWNTERDGTGTWYYQNNTFTIV